MYSQFTLQNLPSFGYWSVSTFHSSNYSEQHYKFLGMFLDNILSAD